MPQFFIEKMDNNITVIDHQPPGLGFAFDPAFSFMRCQGFLDHSIGQSVQHAAAGGGANDEVVGERSNFLNIQQNNIFPLSVFQGIDYGVCKFKCIQMSPPK